MTDVFRHSEISSDDEGAAPYAYRDVTPELVLDLLKIPPEGSRIGDCLVKVLEDPIPMDSQVLRCELTDRSDIRLVLKSETCDAVTEGQALRQLKPLYSRTLVEP